MKKFCWIGKDMVTNITTGLMALRDLECMYNIPIIVMCEGLYINITVNAGRENNKQCGFYLQDTYRFEQQRDSIYEWVLKAIEEIVDGKKED